MARRPAPILVPEDVWDIPLPEGVQGWELVDGFPVPVMPASPDHGELALEVGYRLKRHLEEHGIPGRAFVDAGFVLPLSHDPTRLRGPDVSFVNEETWRKHHDRKRDFGRFGRFVPDLAVEIELSSGRKPGGLQRVRDYLEAGVRLVWDVHPHTRSATVYRPDGSRVELTGEDALDGEDVIPGFRLPLAKLFG